MNIKKQILNILIKIRDQRIITGRINNWRKVFNDRNQKRFSSSTILTHNQLEEISRYYENYRINPSSIFHQFYRHCTGDFDVRYIPDDLYYTYIDPYYNDWEFARYLDNKTLYHLIFPNIKQPKLLAYRQNGFWFDENNNLIDKERVIDMVSKVNSSFVKQATDSEGGKGIYVLDKSHSRQDILDCLSKITKDIVIQEALKQSKTLSLLNESSVNTIRLLTLLRSDGSVKLCSTSLRMGVKGSKVDNASSGGITVGVKSDGTLKDKAYSASGECYVKHPSSNAIFSTIKVPNYRKVVDLVTIEAKRNPYFRLISWDIALDEDDEPVLIEANLKYGELEFHQLNNGPIFGDETKTILEEVFGKAKK